MTLQELQDALTPSAKDIKLNLANILSDDASELSPSQIYGIALASAYASKDTFLISSILKIAGALLSPTQIEAIKTATTIMAMNNVYYRFVHLVNDPSYGALPAKLRMNALANPGIDKIDFELCSLAVSAINGCGMCMSAHAKQLEHAGASKLMIHSAIRIAAVINASACGLMIALTE